MKKLTAGLMFAALAGAAVAQTQPQAQMKTEQAPQATAGVAAAKPAAELTIARSAVCTGINDREPSGTVENAELKADVGVAYFWTEVQAKDVPTTIKHRWSRDGKQMAEIELAVKYPRTRTWSTKKIVAGAWKVEAVSASGEVIKSAEFKVVP